MAFSGLTSPAPTQLQLLLEEIKFQQQKELQQASLQDCAGFMSRGTTYWTDVFVRHFLFQNERAIDADDLLFFIRKKHVRGNVTLPKFQTDVEVFRKDSKKLPIGDPEIEWQETVYLNLLIHQLEYTLTLAICTRTSPKDLQVLKRHSQKVYASPSRRRMDTKGEVEEITYPYLSFMVDNFDEVYSEMTIRDGEMVCVELLAADRDGGFQAVLFLGSIRYDALKRVYDSRASLGSKMAQRMTFGLFSSSHSQRVEYVRLKGPYGKGHAEVAVSKPKGAGVETPTSEPGFCMTDGIWDSDVESDSEDFVFKHHRRLSDPSSNLNNYTRSGWRSIKGGGGGSTSEVNAKRTRSQNEGLDYCGLAEIEAGDVRDDSRVDDDDDDDGIWCCGCCGCECMQSQRNLKDNETQITKSCDTKSTEKTEIETEKEKETETVTLKSRGRGSAKNTSKVETETENDWVVVPSPVPVPVPVRVPSSSTTRSRTTTTVAAAAKTNAKTNSNSSTSATPTTCCGCPCPFQLQSRSESLTFDQIPLHPLPPNSKFDSKYSSTNTPRACPHPHRHSCRCHGGQARGRVLSEQLSHDQGAGSRRIVAGRPPLLPSKTVVVPPTNSPFYDSIHGPPGQCHNILDKSSSIACLQDAKFICKEKLLRTFPNKLTSSGVRILYMCDVKPSENKTELDDGAYNPLWTMRGFTQTFHMWRESRRAQSVPLNAFLTYITLPCTSIMKDILEHRDEPVLTF